MKLNEAIAECLGSDAPLSIRRESWLHADSFVVTNKDSYMGGELWYKISGHKAELFFVDDLISNDWVVE
jgi:hypothetical protein